MQPEMLAYHAAQVASLLEVARAHVEQLVLVTGGHWQARSELLQHIASAQGLKYLALGLPLAKLLLEQSPRQRPQPMIGCVE